MQIFVSSLLGKHYSLEVEYWFTIREVKQLLFKKSGILPSSQMLIYNGKLLYNYMNLADINIQSDDNIIVADLGLQGKWFNVHFKSPEFHIKRITKFGVRISDSIENLKNKIQDLTGIMVDKIGLRSNDKILLDSQYLIDLEVYIQNSVKAYYKE